jgi:hypothetical protein
MDTDSYSASPTVAIGGVGGSGTRIVAKLLAKLGLYIGGDLNSAHDNLWFTFLFKRRSVLTASDREVAALFRLFCARMAGTEPALLDTTALAELAERPRLLHSGEWLEQRRRTFCDTDADVFRPKYWGWKEPNTHIVVDRLLAADERLRYVHVVRNGFYMSASRNQNQLQLWGPIFLDREVEITPRDSLSYWCSAHKNAIACATEHPGRVLFVDFDELCAKPMETAAQLAKFIGVVPPTGSISAWRAGVEPQRREARDLVRSLFNREDFEFATACGYEMQPAAAREARA